MNKSFCIFNSNASRICAIFVLLCSSFQLLAGDGGSPVETSVGEVVLLIGKVGVTHASGANSPLQRGDSIRVGDLVETSSGGHAHIKFVDGGVVSVRPESRLRIELYKYDVESPKKSAIRFSLEKGVVRSISGKATEAAHERYRLNTPIAALGVLGTDYVVRVSDSETWVAVYSGGVAVAPLSSSCLAAGLGVCEGATRLTKGMGNLVLLYRSGEQQAELKSLTSKLEGSGEQDPAQEPESQLMDSSDAPIEERLVERVGLDESIRQRELSGALRWGRWWSEPLVGDDISLSHGLARSGKEITVGDLRFGLFRDTTKSFRLMPKQGVYTFDLIRSFVYFTADSLVGSQPTQGRLDGGALEVDFLRDTFSTHLDLSHPEAGEVSLDVAGSIGRDGIFSAKNSNSRVAGALTEDGLEAGLLFERRVSNGVFKGISDWRR